MEGELRWSGVADKWNQVSSEADYQGFMGRYPGCAALYGEMHAKWAIGGYSSCKQYERCKLYESWTSL
jgi:hypothetical protein